MTDDELKTLPPDPAETVVEVGEDKKPNAADEAAERLKKQLEGAEAGRKAALETAEAERAARMAAEQRAQQRDQEMVQARSTVQSVELQAINTAIEGETRVRDMAKVELARAMEAGEWTKVADAQANLSEAAAKLVQLEQHKNYAAAHVQRNEGRIDQRQQQDHQQVDPVEAMINSATPATQAWLRQHRDMVSRDGRGMPRLDSRLLAAHHLAEADGIRADSPEYFQFIESRVYPQKSADDTGQNGQTQQAQTAPRRASVAAPVSRDGNAGTGRQNTTRMQLTAAEVEAAHMFGDPKKTEREREIAYWQDKQALKDEGRIGNLTH